MAKDRPAIRLPALVDGGPIHFDPSGPATLPEMLRRAAEMTDRGITFVDDRGDEQFVSYARLVDQAERMLAGLTRLGLGPRDRVILLARNRLESVVAFWGCVFGGITVVPLPHGQGGGGKPSDDSLDSNLEMKRIGGVWQQLGRPPVIVPRAETAYRERLANFLAAPRLFCTEELIEGSPARPTYQPTAGDTAMLLYSSGSTSRPKGIVVTHHNIRANTLATAQHNRLGADDTALCWAPLYHVIGLMCFHLLPIATGAGQLLIEPWSLVKRPRLWFDKIHAHRVAFTGGPNFIFPLSRAAISEEQLGGWDLSCVKVLLNGGEVVSVRALEEFQAYFSKAGLRAEALAPAYGMSEATAGIAYPTPDEPLQSSRIDRHRFAADRTIELVGAEHADSVRFAVLGRVLPGLSLRIVDQNDRLLEERQVGEIQIRGSSVTSGYYDNAEANRTNFCDGWLRTGDLGFLDNGQLTIVGRTKEVLVIKGHNYYAHDLEQVAQTVPGVVAGCVVATCAMDRALERELALLFVAVSDSAPSDVLDRIKRAVARSAGLNLDRVIGLAPEAFPRTATGKIHRLQLKELFEQGRFEPRPSTSQAASRSFTPAATLPGMVTPHARATDSAPIAEAADRSAANRWQRDQVEHFLVARLAEALGVEADAIDADASLVDLGIDSIEAVKLIGDLQRRLETDLPATLAFDHPTVSRLAAHLLDKFGARAVERLRAPGEKAPPRQSTGQPTADQPSPDKTSAARPEAVPAERAVSETRGFEAAIVGMACRYPGAASLDEFWRNLRDGVDSIGRVPPRRWPTDAFGDDAALDSNDTQDGPWGGFVAGIDRFDPQFFGISPHEAQRMDPQQRLLLETCWQALESAGYAGDRLSGLPTGVFVGASLHEYMRHVFSHRDKVDAYAATGNFLSILANRVSYLLNLKGPSLAVDTACSSSLVALHLAMASLERGECDQAVVAGVHGLLSPELWLDFSDAGMLAADGRAKVFDARADGYVRGEGVGVVLLKPASHAVRDGDEIHAVLRGTAMNQDGHTNGLTAPSRTAQAEVIRAALRRARVAAGKISYVEAHGTGTKLGDPIELAALADVFRDACGQQKIGIGSVKTNIGHLEPASGMASLLKVVLALKHEQLPPSLHFVTPNEHLRFEQTPLFVVDRLRPWRRSATPRRAGISAFGFGGTNAHAIVEEAPHLACVPAPIDRPRHVLALSARSETALLRLAQRFVDHWTHDNTKPVADTCFTTNTGRRHWPHRLAVVGSHAAELQKALETFCAGHVSSSAVQGIFPGKRSPSIAFLFPGQGVPYAGMAQTLYETQPVFRQAVERCDDLLRGEFDRPLVSVLLAGNHVEDTADTGHTQTAIFTLDYALFELWRSWGIEPSAVVGHSLGEYVAACVAGVMSLEDALRLVAIRARLMNQLETRGAMLAILADESQVAASIAPFGGQLTIAAVNGPRNTVVSGSDAAIVELETQLRLRDVVAQRLHVARAFHSPLIEPMLDDFERFARGIRFRPPRLPLLSNLFGRWFKPGEVPDAAYWRRHARQTVRYADCLSALFHRDISLMLEVGPGTTLTTMGRRVRESGQRTWLVSLSPGRDAWRTLLASLATLYCHGVKVDWIGFDQPYRRRRTTVPTYPFERQRYWIDLKKSPSPQPLLAPPRNATEPALEAWFHKVCWRAETPTRRRRLSGGAWIVFQGAGNVGQRLARRFELSGRRVVLVKPGQRFEACAADKFTVRLSESRDLRRLIESVESAAGPIQGVLHLWSCQEKKTRRTGTNRRLRDQLAHGAESALLLAREFACRRKGGPRELWLVTNDAATVGDSAARLSASNAAICGLARTAARELPGVKVRCVDFASHEPSRRVAAQLWDELNGLSRSGEVAYRDGQRFTPRLEPVTADDGLAGGCRLREQGVYLITGGLGGLGLEMAKVLATEGRRRLVLAGRRRLPAEDAWPTLIKSGECEAAVLKRIRAIHALRASGAEVWPAAVNVADTAAVHDLIQEILSRYGTLDGVVHAAGVLDDRMLSRTSLADFHRVFDPKVQGALALDRATRTLKLDFFILCSSAAAFWGNMGQASYAAASAFLDTMAQVRQTRRAGVAMSLAWTPWSQVGMAARTMSGEDWNLTGLRPIDPQTGRRLFARAIERPRSHYVLFAPRDSHADAAERPFISGDRGIGEPPLAAGDAHRSTPPPAPGDRGAPATSTRSSSKLAPALCKALAMETALLLSLAEAEVADDVNLMELGFDSIMATRLTSKVSTALGVELSATVVFAHPTLGELAAHLAEHYADACRRWVAEDNAPVSPDSKAENSRLREVGHAPSSRRELAVTTRRLAKHDETGDRDIAMVAAACRLPAADSPEAFWQLLREGRDCVSRLSPERCAWAGRRVDDLPPAARWGAFLDNVQGFDAATFGISPKEARLMDPQQRLFLELVWETLERAGYSPERIGGLPVGVFVGVSNADYLRLLDRAGGEREGHIGSGNALTMIANRVSYMFDLKGPSLAIDTACSSSLVAVHMACESLRRGESELALAGGVNLTLLPDHGEVLARSGMLSPDGRSKTFDDRANGYVRGEGAAVVMLRPLARAVDDGDPILAVIKSTAVNHDGHSKMAVTAPNPKAQCEVIRRALLGGNIDPASLGYLEAHGTGTALGDPLEVEALCEAFRGDRVTRGRCAVGSVKTNLGHLESAAGIAGLLKVALTVQHGELPPTLHMQTPNRHIRFERTPFYVNDRLRVWPPVDGPRRAGISSFGAGGTNAHVVIEVAPQRSRKPVEADPAAEVLVLSARTEDALKRLVKRYLEYLNRPDAADMADICYTAWFARAMWPHRLAIVARYRDLLADRLRQLAAWPQRGVLQSSLIFSGRANQATLVDWSTWLEPRLARLSNAALTLLQRSCPSPEFERTVGPWIRERTASVTQPDTPLRGEMRVDLLAALASLFVHGVAVDWSVARSGAKGRRVVLPTYPFEHQRYWLSDRTDVLATDVSAAVGGQPEKSPRDRDPIAKTKGGQTQTAAARISAKVPSRLEPRPTFPESADHAEEDRGLSLSEKSQTSRAAITGERPSAGVQRLVIQFLADVLEMPAERIAVDRPLLEMGVDSMIATEVARSLSQCLDKSLPHTLLFDYPTIRQLADALAGEYGAARLEIEAGEIEAGENQAGENQAGETLPPGEETNHAARTGAVAATNHAARAAHHGAIAVIGLSGRFPQAADLRQFWENLASGVDAVGEVAPSRWRIDRHFSSQRDAAGKTYSKWAALLEHIDRFDAPRFHIARREAEQMDPQQRILLEVACEAMESAGYAAGQLARCRTGVFVGAMRSEYLERLLAQPEQMDVHVGTGNATSVVANRLSYTFDLKGPCLAIDTACSSSLVALHMAMESLRRGQCDVALVGGTQAGLAVSHFQVMSRLGALSPTGRCRAFGRQADGYVLGEGVAALLIKPLEQALADGDAIRGVLLGSAVNHGGQAAGLTVPNSRQQAEVVREALSDARVPAETIDYLEAHGTGTSLGDPIEVDSLTRAMREQTTRRQFCAIGSVKSNLGHLEPAAGLAGVVKVILAIEARQIPPTLHVDEVNPAIEFEHSPFYVCDRLQPWPYRGHPRRAGVSSFGFGGTNAHVVIEEAPRSIHQAPEKDRRLHLLTLSAASAKALSEYAGRFARHLRDHAEGSLADVCFSANVGRPALKHRLAVVAETRAALTAALESFSRTETPRRGSAWCTGIAVPDAESGLKAIETSILRSKLETAPPGVVAALADWCVEATVRRQIADLAQQRTAATSPDPEQTTPSSESWKPSDWHVALNLLAELYVSGVAIDWPSVEAGFHRKRVPLPTYPFQRQRYWIDDKPVSPRDAHTQDDPASAPGESERHQRAKDAVQAPLSSILPTWLHEFDWWEMPLADGKHRDPLGPWLVWSHDREALGEATVGAMQQAGAEVVRVVSGDRFAGITDGRATLDPDGGVDEWSRLIAACAKRQPRLCGVVAFPATEKRAAEGLEEIGENNSNLTANVDRTLHLMQALVNLPAAERPALWVVCEDESVGQISKPALRPDTAAIWALARVARLEHPGWRVGGLSFQGDRGSIAESAQTIAAELASSGASFSAAYVGGRRWNASLRPFDPRRDPSTKLCWPRDGVYLITGGLGALGLQAAETLVELGARHLVLIGRTGLPPESQWDGCLKSISGDDPLVRRIQAVCRWRDQGVEVWPVAADAANATALRQIVNRIHHRAKTLRGVVHAAGVLRDALLRHASLKELHEVLHAKAGGIDALANATRNEPLDFFVSFSSLAALTGNVGQASYAAANAWMDAAAERWRRRGVPMITLGWGPWTDSGMASSQPSRNRFRAVGLKTLEPRMGRRLLAAVLGQSPLAWAVYAADAENRGYLKLAADDARRRVLEFPHRRVPLDGNAAEALPKHDMPRPRANRPTADRVNHKPRGNQAKPRRIANETAIRRVVHEVFCEVLRLDVAEVDVEEPLQELGVDSLMAEEAVVEINRRLNIEFLTAPRLFEHSSISRLSRYLAERQECEPAADVAMGRETSPEPRTPAVSRIQRQRSRSQEPGGLPESRERSGDIAVVGYAGRFPGADSVEALWELLRRGEDAIGPLCAARWEAARARNPQAARETDPTRLVGGFLENVDRFDPEFFGTTPTEARQMDPRQRLFLEVAYEALERAGYGGNRLRGTRTGVFVASGAHDYLVEVSALALDVHSATGGTAATLPSRLAYFLDLRGPCLPVDTACSSSLVALHLAIESLRRGECNHAVVGAVHLYLRLTALLALRRTGAVSRQGRCRTFDVSADGFVPGEGVGAMLLKPLDAAIHDHDTIYGVIKSAAVNNDGRTSGLTAPNPGAQRDVILAAWRDAEIDPTTISYIEAHGTGTPLGDPIEVEALTEAFRRHTKRRGFCRLGSIKSNLGHLDAAAGMAGLIKILLSFEHGQLPPTLGVDCPNPRIRFDDSPLVIQAQHAAWKPELGLRRAGISAFGFGGTNAHVIIEQPPPLSDKRTEQDRPTHILAISARDRESLESLGDRYLDWLDENREIDLRDLCFTAATGRRHEQQRLAIVAGQREQLADRLNVWRCGATQRGRKASLIFCSPENNREADRLFEQQAASRLEKLPADAAAWIGSLAKGTLVEAKLRPLLPTDVVSPAPPKLSAEEWGDLCSVLAVLYVLRADIDWDRFDAGLVRRRVCLPATPLHRGRFWIEVSPDKESHAKRPRETGTESHESEGSGSDGASDLDSWIYQPAWRESVSQTPPPAPRHGSWIVFHDQGDLARAVIDRLRLAGNRVLEVEPGTKFNHVSPRQVTLRPGSATDYDQLCQEIAGGGDRWSGVLHFWSSIRPETADAALGMLDTRLDRTIVGMFHLTKALARHLSAKQGEFELRVITRGGDLVVGPSECTSPESGAVAGFLRAAGQELRGIRCQRIEIPAILESMNDTASRLLAELHAGALDREVAIRGRRRYVMDFAPLVEPQSPDRPIHLRQEGVYLITGGLGGIGLELANWLAERCRAKIVLTSRRDWTSRNNAPANSNGSSTTVPALDHDRIAERIREIESLGSDVIVLTADVADLQAMRKAVQKIYRCHGRLDGVFHVAGTIRKGSIRDETVDQLGEVLRPKILGSWVIDCVTADKPLDFVVLFSSLAGRIGNVRQADYSAANRFLDSFAQWRDAQGRRTMAIDWGMWAGVGMSRQAVAAQRMRGDSPMRARQALAALNRIFQLGGTQWIVTSQTMPRFPAVSQHTSAAPERPQKAEIRAFSRSRHGELVQALARHLSEITGLDPQTLDPRRSFLEIGLDSMLAIRFVRALESHAQRRLSATLPFDYPNLVALATQLEEMFDREAIEGLLRGCRQPTSQAAPTSSAAAAEHAEPTGRNGRSDRQGDAEPREEGVLRLSSGRRVTRILRGNQ